MLQLVANTEESASTSIPIRWCVDGETRAKLQEKEALNPHLLLVVARGGYEVSRCLVPIDQIMEYVDFQRPGIHKIFAAVVWNSRGDTRVLEKRIFGGKVTDNDGKVREFDEKQVLNCEGELELHDKYKSDHNLALCSIDDTASIEVNVAEEFFASPPSKFEKFWVNFWFERTAGNQCQFRRRRMLAYSIQPFVVLLYMLGKTIVRGVIALSMLLCGFRGVNLHPLIHPWAMDNNDIWWHMGRSVFTATKDGKSRKFIVVVCEISNAIEDHGSDIMTTVVLIGLAAIAIKFGFRYPLTVAVIATIVGVVLLTGRLVTMKARKLEALPENERKQILLERENARYQGIACNGPMVASLSALPEERRTIYLRYKDIKAKLCKQFGA